AVIDEMGDVAQAMVALDQSYLIQPPLAVQVHTVGPFGGFGGFGFSGGGFFGGFGSAAAGSQFVDAALYADCGRAPMKVQEFRRGVQPAPGAVPAPGEAT